MKEGAITKYQILIITNGKKRKVISEGVNGDSAFNSYRDSHPDENAIAWRDMPDKIGGLLFLLVAMGGLGISISRGNKIPTIISASIAILAVTTLFLRERRRR